MGDTVRITFDGRTKAVDGRDLAAWDGNAWDGGGDHWLTAAEEYVEYFPRIPSGVPQAQRIAILRRLAAGPARRAELLEAMRHAAGWVGADDLENRLRELRGGPGRGLGARAALPLKQDGDTYWLDEPFPALHEDDRRALAFAKAMMERLDGPLPRDATRALERLLPGLASATGERTPVRYRASAADYLRFDTALRSRRPVRVRYFSLNSGRERTYDLVPVEYFVVGPTVKALCVQVTSDGVRVGEDRQFALDRLLAVEDLPDWPAPTPSEVRLQRAELVLQVTDALYQVMEQRNLFGVRNAQAKQDPHDDSWTVRGSFPVALGWDVMEQLCAWAGSSQVHEPLWLVNAVVRRLRAGLRVQQEGADFELVKPEPQRQFATKGEAVAVDEPLPPPKGPTRLLLH